MYLYRICVKKLFLKCYGVQNNINNYVQEYYVMLYIITKEMFILILKFTFHVTTFLQFWYVNPDNINTVVQISVRILLLDFILTLINYYNIDRL